MKYICILIITAFFATTNFAPQAIAQNIDGAWQRKADTLTITMIVADGYFMTAAYSTEGNRFVYASGGIMKASAGSIETEIEFNSANANEVGSNHLYDFKVANNQLTTRHHDDEETWTRLDDGKPGLLAGAWLFSGRRAKPDDAIEPFTPGVRKTMKILSGTRFQWAAYNTETKVFSGTGGGTYTTIDGKYTESIDFFSRDNSRVGASLSFSLAIEEPHWLHSGKSSKGDPIYERWSRRKSFANQ